MKQLISLLTIVLMLTPIAFSGTQDREQYVINEILESSYNEQLWQDYELNISQPLNKGFNKSDILSVEEAKILIDEKGPELMLLKLEKELIEQNFQIQSLIDDTNQDNNSNKINKINELKTMQLSIDKLITEISSMDISNLTNYEIAQYYIDKKYDAIILINTVNNINENSSSKQERSNLLIDNSIDNTSESNELDSKINNYICEYNSDNLAFYLNKLGIEKPLLINGLNKCESSKIYLNNSLREEIEDLDSYEIDIAYERLKLKERLEYQKIISLYEKLNLTINNTEIIQKIFD